MENKKKGGSTMKKRTALLALAGFALLALVGCRTAAETEETASPAIEPAISGSGAPADSQPAEPGDDPDDILLGEPVTCRVKVLSNDFNYPLVTDWDEPEYAVGLYNMSVKDAQISGADGETAALESLRPGMILDVTWDGLTADTFPGSFAADQVRVVAQGDDLVGLYRQVLAELWTETGQKAGVKRLGFDFSGLTDLSAGERSALAYLTDCDCKPEMGLNYALGTWDEMAERGSIAVDDEGYWTDGMLLSLSLYEQEDGHVGIIASSSRAKGGAIMVLTCTADRQEDGSWSYQSFSPSGT